ncbi:putative late blight resistance protein homolog R1A-4 [Salvia splendens]|uniref:putative late blight resistance protein homolog R1A-4 n=1 Tax=Salvia splendens TaxID=180675 RepID=UPI001C27FED0|nr:putative late blight resistance protein homolog R1A-4 [Salvia splendens]XP_042038741.1 putative late blight resistance protein homolog R1A-4 [Salvia splendens]
MAYNLQSLITILQQILHPEQTRWTFDHNKPQLESLLEKAESLLQQILEKSSPNNVIESLESRIRYAAYKAEDVIESCMVHQMLSTPQGVDKSLVLFSFFTPYLEQVIQQLDLQQDLERVTQELDFAMEQVVKLMEGTAVLGGSGLRPDVQQAAQKLESVKLMEVEEKKMRTRAPFSSSKNDLVGVDDELLHLKDRLTNMGTKMEIISIVGMGGTGKSTLARNLYDDPLIISHFDYRGWATISHDPIIREVVWSLLHGPNKKIRDELIECNIDELKTNLYKRLLGRRYMIVLDDTWSTKVWDEIRMCFPDDNNGSRIVLTTRMTDLARYVSNENDCLVLNFLMSLRIGIYFAKLCLEKRIALLN